MDETLLLVQKIKAMYNTKTFSKSDNAIAECILNNPDCLAGGNCKFACRSLGHQPGDGHTLLP